MAYESEQQDIATQSGRPDPRALLEVLSQLEAEFEQLFSEWRARALGAEQ
jgi:hypothetical protein